MTASLLKRGRLARTERVTWRGREVVRKTVEPVLRVPLLTSQFGCWLLHRELRQLRRAEGIPGIPRVLGRPAPNVGIREWVPGTSLPRASAPPVEFFLELLSMVEALHARHTVHNDLHKEANVIVTPEGRPAILDFQLSVTLAPGSEVLRLLRRFDRYHVVKNMRHRTGCTLSPEHQELFDSTRRLRKIMRAALKKPMNLLTRHWFHRLLAKHPQDTDP